MIKTKLQAQRTAHGHAHYQGVVGKHTISSSTPLSVPLNYHPSISATVRSIIVHDGLRGLYRGLGPTILGYLPTWAIYFAVYDGLKSRYGQPPLGQSSAQNQSLYPAPSAKGYQPVIREHPWSVHILSAMCAGGSSTIATNPLWVIKTRFMVHLPSASSYSLQALKSTWAW